MADMTRRNNWAWDKNGHFRPNNNQHIKIPRKKEVNPDTENRKKVLDEMIKRVKEGEDLEGIAKEISERDYIKTQFKYLIDSGIIKNDMDFANLFKGWFESYKKNLTNNFVR